MRRLFIWLRWIKDNRIKHEDIFHPNLFKNSIIEVEKLNLELDITQAKLEKIKAQCIALIHTN